MLYKHTAYCQPCRQLWQSHCGFAFNCESCCGNSTVSLLPTVQAVVEIALWFCFQPGILLWKSHSVSTANPCIEPKVIFSVALKCNASGIILAHNHPSGNLNPSNTDLELTKLLKSRGQIFEIQILDHII